MRIPDGISTWFMLLATIGTEACKRMEMLSPLLSPDAEKWAASRSLRMMATRS